MPAYDGRTKLEASRDHFETFGKGANYLLVGHGAGFAGCLTLVTQHQAEVNPLVQLRHPLGRMPT